MSFSPVTNSQVPIAPSVLLRKLGSFRRRAGEVGTGRACRIAAEWMAISFLAKRYSFPVYWHNPTSVRPYRLAVADAVNRLDPQVVCEVGCGLGSILARSRAPKRVGYDLDPGVIEAARLIRRRGIDFRQGTISDVSLAWMDVLILVNWIHEIAPQDLERDLWPLLARTRFLVLDAIDPGSPGYSYYHDFGFLKERTRQVSAFRVPGEGRTFLVLEISK